MGSSASSTPEPPADWPDSEDIPAGPFPKLAIFGGVKWAFRLFVGGIMAVPLLFLLVFGPPITHDRPEPERSVTGTVVHFGWSVESRDVQIRLEDDAHHYYINRALDMGMEPAVWRSALLGSTVTLQVVHRSWGLARWTGVGPIRGIILDGDTLYRTGRLQPLP